MFKAIVRVTRRPSILDPQGKAVHHALQSLGFGSVEEVRMGKYVEIWIDEATEEAALQTARLACEKLIANPIMEDFDITIESAEAVA